MKAYQLIKFGKSGKESFQLAEIEEPIPSRDQVKIKIDGFGLNFADVMCRRGTYNECPPLPAVLGYECVGTVDAVGENVNHVQVGDRVIGFTRFGSYAEYTVTDYRAVIKIGNELSNGEAVALGTQYCTAWFAAIEAINIREGEHVLVHAAAGGVGTALIQILKWKGCVVYGTAGSSKKLEYLKSLGVDHAINYREEDFVEVIQKIRGKARLDVIFDPIGGKNFRKSLKVLGYGGRIVPFGASSRQKSGIISLLKLAFGFGLYLPAGHIMKSQTWAGVNMLRIADYKPELIQKCLKNVYRLYEQKIAVPHVGGTFKADDIGDAHDFLESRKSIGKIVVEW